MEPVIVGTLTSLISILLTIAVGRLMSNSVIKKLLDGVDHMSKDLSTMRSELLVFAERLTNAIKDISDNNDQHIEIYNRLNSVESEIKVIKAKK